MANTKEMLPVYDSAKSFYKKAKIELWSDKIHLISYETKVATIQYNQKGYFAAEVFGTYGATTLRHIKEFLKQHGFKAETKKQIEADYMGGNQS